MSSWLLLNCLHSVGAGRNPTKRLYLDQAKRFSDMRKENNINTESWQMSGDHFIVLQGTINQATLFDELWSSNLSQSHFKKYFNNMSGDIGIDFDGWDSILSVPWHDIIHYSHIIMFLASHLTSHVCGYLFSDLRTIRNMRTMFFNNLLLNTLVTCARCL